jgi:uncharacterized protein (DUF2126 family)
MSTSVKFHTVVELEERQQAKNLIKNLCENIGWKGIVHFNYEKQKWYCGIRPLGDTLKEAYWNCYFTLDEKLNRGK